MGRLQYLERMALGRSAFEDLPPRTSSDLYNPEDMETIPEEPQNAHDTTHQRYDYKGRPTNHSTIARNGELRHAYNELLALVGVVERKDQADHSRQVASDLERVTRDRLLSAENDAGMEVELVADVLAFFAKYGVSTFVGRVLAGVYGNEMSFAGILVGELQGLRKRGFGGLLPGLGLMALQKVLWHLLALPLEEGISRVQVAILRSSMRRKNARRATRSLLWLNEALLVGIDFLLLPINLLELGYRLNLTQATPWRHLLTTTLPALYRHTLPQTLSTFLSTPYPWLLLHTNLHRTPPPESFWTTYQPLPTTASISPSSKPPPSPLRDPIGAVFHRINALRQHVLTHAFGWTLNQSHPPSHSGGWETDLYVSEETSHPRGTAEIALAHHSATPTAVTGRVSTHRSTALARLPASWLGARLDRIIWMIVTLPLNGLVLRKATSWWTGVEAGPVQRVGLGAHVSHVGLALALDLAVEGVLFAGVYGVVRRKGRRAYGWGERDAGGKE